MKRFVILYRRLDSLRELFTSCLWQFKKHAAKNAADWTACGTSLIFFVSTLSLASDQSTNQLGWRQQSSGVLSKLNAVRFIDPQHGWAAGNAGTVLTTVDGGENWRRVALPEYERQEPILDVWPLNSERSFLLGEYDLYDRRPEIESNKRVFLLRSENDFSSWKRYEFARLPAKPSEKKPVKDKEELPDAYPEPVLLRMFFANEQTGWACGELGAVQATTDGGATWRMQFTGSLRIFYDVTAIDEKQAWISGAAGVVLHTFNGGQNWNEQPSGVTESLRAIHFTDVQHGWAAGTNGTIISTRTGGSRWQKLNSGTREALNDIFFVSANEGWVSGDRGTLLHTTDGGLTWESELLKTHASLTRLFFLAPDRGWVVGSNGAIFKYGVSACPGLLPLDCLQKR